MRKLFFLAALLLLAPLAAQAQVYPAPPNVGLAANRPVNCVASNPGQPQEPQWYFATDTSVLSICIATNTWQNTTGGGGGGGIGGGGSAGFLGEWTNGTTIANSLCQDVSSSVLICGESVSVGANAFMISKPNAASGTTQFLAVTWDANRNALTALPGNSVRGIAALGAGASGTVQIAIGGEYPWLCDNQTVVNDWLVESTTTAGECHDVGASELPGVQNIAQVAGANSGTGTATLADIFTPDTTNAPAGPPTVIQVNGNPLASTTANFNSTTPAAPANNVNLPFATDGLTPSGVSVAAPLATGSQAGFVELGTDLGGSYTAPNVVGIQGIPCTLTGTPVASQVWGFSSPTACTNLSLGVAPRTYSIATDTILSTDRTGWVIPTHSGTVATTLPQAGTTGFTSNFPFATLNNATGTNTITPTTPSTINGGASLAVLSKWFSIVISDNTNYFAAVMPTALAFPSCADSAGNHLNFTAGGGITCGNSGSGSGITSINTSATGPAVTIQGSGSTNVTTSGNTVTVTGVNGPPSPTVNLIATGSYTIQNSDNSWRDVFSNGTGAVAVTLPQANTISLSPFVAVRYGPTSVGTCTACTTGTFTQNAGDSILVYVMYQPSSGSTPAVTTFSDLAGDSCRKIADVNAANGGQNDAAAVIECDNVSASASNTFTVNMSPGTSGGGTNFMSVVEYTGLTPDHTTSGATATGSLTLSLNNSFTNEVALGFDNGQSTAGCPPGWTQRTFHAYSCGIEKLLSSNSSVAWQSANTGGDAGVLMNFGINGTPVFTAGWYVTLENIGTNLVTITPTTSTINGQTTLVLVPDQTCTLMSDGANYNAICGTIPNIPGNGLIGQKVEIAGVNTSNTGADVGATTLFTTRASDAFYEVNAFAVCRTSVAGTETVTITYTDTNSLTQTFAATTGTCNSTPAVATITGAFRAKASTNIQYTTTHASSQPSYDVSVAIYQLSTK